MINDQLYKDPFSRSDGKQDELLSFDNPHPPTHLFHLFYENNHIHNPEIIIMYLLHTPCYNILILTT